MIRITFADGSHEERRDDSPCLPTLFDPPRKHPGEERWYLHFPDARHPLSFCAIDVRTLESMRGFSAVYVWRIICDDGEPLLGQWERCHVETFEEQIARLTAERDAAIGRADAPATERHDALRVAAGWEQDFEAEQARADAAEKRLADLRAWAESEIATWGVSCGCMGKVMARIDGKDGG